MDKNNDFKLKYLKYKKKYFALQDILTYSRNSNKPKGSLEHMNKNKYLSLRDGLNKNKLSGGAICPRIGFNQHSGECWNDSFSMIMLYSDYLSDPIQQLFDNDFLWNGIYDPNELWIEYINDFENNKHLLPPNIETKEDFNKFLTEGKLYIEQLFNRYHNDKKPQVEGTQSYLLKPQKLSELLKVPTDLLERYVYFNNLNISTDNTRDIPREYIKEQLDALFKQIQEEYHMRKTKELLPSYTKLTTRHRSDSSAMSLKCVEHSFNIANINKIENIQENGGGLINIILNLSIINYFLIGYYYRYIKTVQLKKSIYKELKLTNYYINYDTVNINININSITSEKINNIYGNLMANKYNSVYIITNNTDYASHAQAFITCTNESDINSFFYDNNSTNESVQKPLQSFNWKEYLINAFEKAYQLGDSLLDLSDIYEIVGKSYLKDFKIESILFFHNIGFIKDFSSNIIDPEEINFINYNNSTIINQYTKYINNINNYNLIDLYIPRIITFNNWKLLDNIMKIKNKQLILKIKEALQTYKHLSSDKIKITTYINS